LNIAPTSVKLKINREPISLLILYPVLKPWSYGRRKINYSDVREREEREREREREVGVESDKTRIFFWIFGFFIYHMSFIHVKLKEN
jgi:hypothetical protein